MKFKNCVKGVRVQLKVTGSLGTIWCTEDDGTVGVVVDGRTTGHNFGNRHGTLPTKGSGTWCLPANLRKYKE